MNARLGLTRNVIKPTYALITPDGYVASALPGWVDSTVHVLISHALGARFSQYSIALRSGGHGQGDTEDTQWFVFCVRGAVRVNDDTLDEGGFAWLPPATPYKIAAASAEATILVFTKIYEPLVGRDVPAAFVGREGDVSETPFLGDPRARLKVLIPDTPAADMAVNIFTYDPGATLPFVETHVMEHGMLFLAGSGVYRLDADWYPVTKGDVIWIAPYCPQWFIAAGPEPARYIYYKDVNRLPA
jgi:(S)-ureidoglycine aminohydrolase